MARPHKTLGVAPDASFEEVRAAYKRLAMQHHPDRGGDIETFQRVKHAYDILARRASREGPFDDIFSEIAKEHKA